MFFKGSRYTGLETDTIIGADGSETAYIRVRMIREVRAVRQHIVVQGDRLDLLAHKYFNNPELFWLLCDVNKAMWPNQLVEEVGRRILVPSTLR